MLIADWGPQFKSRNLKLFDNQVIMIKRPVITYKVTTCDSQAHEQQRHSGKHATAQTWPWAIMVPLHAIGTSFEVLQSPLSLKSHARYANTLLICHL